ncbi:MAG TPA: NADH-quinone oxidoreductase subunit K [Nitrososphaerales archaeon]|nr:NADH-quinone oxidoreductase subunit K [Nitrososphaerales archaeon]
MTTLLTDLITLSAAGLLIATFGVVVRRSFVGWVSAYRYQSVVLAASTAVVGYSTGFWDIYAAALLTLVVKAEVIPRLLVRVTSGVEGGLKMEANPYVSIRLSVLISALLVALSYAMVGQILASAKLDALAQAYLPVSVSLFFIGLFAMVSRRTALNQVVGLLIIENGLFLFTTALTRGVSLIIEVGILADALVGVVISAALLTRMSRTFDTMDTGSLEKLKDD